MSDLTSTSASTTLADDIKENANLPKSGRDFAVVPLDPIAITINVGNQNIVYGGLDSATFNYTVAEGQLDEGHHITMTYALDMDESDLTDSGHAKVGSYSDVITATAVIIDQDGVDVTELYDIAYDFGDLTVAQRVLSVTISNQSMTYGDELPDLASDAQSNYSFDPDALASGDTLSITLEYDIPDSVLSSSGNVPGGIHAGAIIMDSYNLSNAENYIFGVNTGNLIVDAREVTVGFNAANKIYDSTTDASRNGDLVIDGVLDGDVVNVFDNNVTYAFSDKNVGEGKTVTATGDLIVTGRDAENYDFTFDDTAEATITPLSIGIGFTANNKIYDGTTAASREGLIMDEVLDGDDIAFDDSGIEYNFENKNVGDDMTVTATGFDAATMLSGADLGNYEITFIDTTTADIVPKDVTIVFTANDKAYDGTTAATRDELFIDGVIDDNDIVFDDSGIEYNFDDASVGKDKTVTATGFDADTMLSGENLENYYITFVDTAVADITKPYSITIKPRDQRIVYGDLDNATFGYEIVAGELWGDHSITVSYAVNLDASDLTDSGHLKVGSYADVIGISQVRINDQNGTDVTDLYDIAYDFGDLTVTQRVLSVTMNSQYMTYGDELPSFAPEDQTHYSFDPNALASGDTLSITPGYDMDILEEEYHLSSSGHLQSGHYTLAIVVDSYNLSNAENYNMGVNYGSLYVIPRDVTVEFNAADKLYDGTTIASRDGDFVIDGVFEGDIVRIFDNNVTYAFSDKNVGEDKTVTATDDFIVVGRDSASYNFIIDYTAQADITPLDITIGFTANDKEYDGTTAATRDALIMDEVLEGDEVVFDDTGIEYTFDNASVGEDKTVTATGFDAATMLSGEDLDNYNITFIDTTTADITPAGDELISITIKVDDKSMVYGDSANTLKFSYTLEGQLEEGHFLTIRYSFYEDNLAWTDSYLIKAGTYEDVIKINNVGIYDQDGNNVTNLYDIAYEYGDLTVDKRNLAVTVSDMFMTYGDELPDLTTDILYTFDPNTLANGDTLDITLGYDMEALNGQLSGSGNLRAGLYADVIGAESYNLSNAENYDVVFNNGSLTVAQKEVNVSFEAYDKEYDGTTQTIGDDFMFDGVLEGDVVSADDTDVTYAFSDKNVGEDKTVTAIGDLIFTGDDGDNYVFTFDNTAYADITPLAIEIGFTVNDKAYDGTTAATRDALIMDNVLEGDDVVFDDTGIEYNFEDASVGNDKIVTATGFDAATMLSGADLGNYEIIFVDTTFAAITEIPVPENLVGTPENLTWSEVTGASGYIVQFSQDDFATVITIKTDTNGIEQYNMSAGTWQWRVRANEGSQWAVGNDITIDSNNTSPVVVIAEDDDIKDALFVQPTGIWGRTYQAEHAGILNGWEGTTEHALLNGKNKIADIYQGGADDANVLLLTDDSNGDALFVDDIYSELPGTIEEQQARLAQIDEIRAGDGDDIIDLTSQRFEYVGGGMTVQGGLGNDVIWANNGNNTLFGDAGNDRIVGAGGNDVIVGGSGDDSMHGGGGDDIFAFGGEWGNDSVEQLADGNVTLWFDEGSLDNWDASTLTYRDGDKAVVVNGAAAESITLKFGDDGSEQYGKLLAAGAFDEFSSDRIFENKNTRGMLA